MKQGRSLTELAQEVERQATVKRDFIADTRTLEFEPAGAGGAYLKFFNESTEQEEDLWIDDLAHRQIAERIRVPVKYYDRMMEEAPELLATNVNHWFQEQPENRLIRALDGRARAFLSDRYRRLDNLDMMMQSIMPVLQEDRDLEIQSCEITEHRLYLKVTTPRLTGEVKKGDIVQAGVLIANSEVGKGAVDVDPLTYTLACLNGMVVPRSLGNGMKRYHVGRRIGSGEEAAAELFTDETIAADDHAFWLKTRDVIRGALDQAIFEQTLAHMRDASERAINGDPTAAVKELAKRFSLTDGEAAGITTTLFKHEEGTQYGLLNAVTRYSQQVESYERATELERVGGEILTLAPHEWKVIAEAKAA
jgi:hypothetical protein